MMYCGKRAGWIAAAMLAVLAAYAVAAERVIARNNLPVVSGGVGEESLARLKAREKEFNLKLVFTLTEGNYVADVGVSVVDAAGRSVIEHVTDGPILMARLPAGAYTVIARYNGQTQTRKVTLRAERLHTEQMRWPANPQGDSPGPVDGRRSDTAPPRESQEVRILSPAVGATAGIAFISGGIGEESHARLKAREKDYNLKLVFTLIEGNYLSDVSVEVKNASGQTVISHVADGPFFLARLPAGSYIVAATYENVPSPPRKIIVGAAGLRTEYFRWKSNPQTDTVLPPER